MFTIYFEKVKQILCININFLSIFEGNLKKKLSLKSRFFNEFLRQLLSYILEVKFENKIKNVIIL